MTDHIEGAEITAFLDGEIASEDRARVDAHLVACAACGREWAALRHMKRVLSTSTRKTMPAELALSLERRFVSGTPWWKTPAKPSFWIPVGATAAAALAVGLWMSGARAADELPLEPLLAAHARYSAEALVPEQDLVASAYSDQLTAMYSDAPDAELE